MIEAIEEVLHAYKDLYLKALFYSFFVIYICIMNYELKRLATFVNFPFVSLCECCYVSSLAENGYYYTGTNDELQCYRCHFKMRLNKNHINLLNSQHQLYSPSCCLEPEQQKSLRIETLSTESALLANGHQQYQYQENSISSNNSLMTYGHFTSDDSNASDDQEEITVDGCIVANRLRSTNTFPKNIGFDSTIPVGQPISPPDDKTKQNYLDNVVDTNDYKYEKNRLLTFRTWPKNDIVPADLLARDGFIYTWLGDRVKCVFCDGMLRAWERQDNPAEEHDRHYPTCKFICGYDVGNIPITVDPRRKRILQIRNRFVGTNLGGSNVIDAREIKARLDTPVVRSIHAMGYPMDLIRIVLLEQLASCGQDFPNMISFIEALKTKQSETTISKAQYDDAAAAAAAPMSSITSSLSAAASSVALVADSKKISHEQVHKSERIDNTLLKNNNKQQISETIVSSSDEPESNKSELALNENFNKEKLKRKRNKKKKTKKNAKPSENQPLVVEQLPKMNEKEKSNPTPKINQSLEPNYMQSTNQMLTANEVPKNIESQPLTFEQPASILRTGKCNLCKRDEINTAFIPCGHTYFCFNCSEPLNHCLVCKAQIHSKIKVYLTS